VRIGLIAGEVFVNRKKQDESKQRYWQATIREAARSGGSIREFCRQRKLKESQFYWWQQRLKAKRQAAKRPKQAAGQASFALVSDEPGTVDAGIELLLCGGRRLRIARGVDEQTLRTVLAAVEAQGC
jgi:hypothetical protein